MLITDKPLEMRYSPRFDPRYRSRANVKPHGGGFDMPRSTTKIRYCEESLELFNNGKHQARCIIIAYSHAFIHLASSQG